MEKTNIKRHYLLHLVADLVDIMRDYGVDNKTIIKTLKYYGYSDKEMFEWYGLKQ